MSDFGLMLSFHRRDAKNITQQEYSDMEKEVTSIFYDQGITNFMGEEFHPQAVEAVNEQGLKGISFIISEYWVEEGEMEESEAQEVMDYDENQAEEILDKIQDMYEDIYVADLYKGYW